MAPKNWKEEVSINTNLNGEISLKNTIYGGINGEYIKIRGMIFSRTPPQFDRRN